MDWKEIKNSDTGEGYLEKSFNFKDFVAAWAFMNKVALLAEKMEHHPDWCNSYNKLTIKLSSHSAGNKITKMDRDFAGLIDKLGV